MCNELCKTFCFIKGWYLLSIAGTAESLCISVILILAAILSALFLSEKIGPIKLISLLICIPGVIMVVQPEILFPPSDGNIINIITEGALNTRWQANDINITTEYALNTRGQANDINITTLGTLNARGQANDINITTLGSLNARGQANDVNITSEDTLNKRGQASDINITSLGTLNAQGQANDINITTEGTLNKKWQARDINSDPGSGFLKQENRKNTSNPNQYSSMDFMSSELLKKQHRFPAPFQSNYTLDRQSTILTPSNTSSAPTYIGYLMAVLSGVGTPVGIVVARGTSIQNEPSEIQVTWIWISGLALSTVTMVMFEHFVLPETLTDWLLLSGHVIFSFIGTATYYYAITLTSGVLVTLTYTTSVILSMLSQYVLTQGVMPGHHNVLEFLGSILVFIAATLNPIVQLVREKCKRADTYQSTE